MYFHYLNKINLSALALLALGLVNFARAQEVRSLDDLVWGSCEPSIFMESYFDCRTQGGMQVAMPTIELSCFHFPNYQNDPECRYVSCYFSKPKQDDPVGEARVEFDSKTMNSPRDACLLAQYGLRNKPIQFPKVGSTVGLERLKVKLSGEASIGADERGYRYLICPVVGSHQPDIKGLIWLNVEPFQQSTPASQASPEEACRFAAYLLNRDPSDQRMPPISAHVRNRGWTFTGEWKVYPNLNTIGLKELRLRSKKSKR